MPVRAANDHLWPRARRLHFDLACCRHTSASPAAADSERAVRGISAAGCKNEVSPLRPAGCQWRAGAHAAEECRCGHAHCCTGDRGANCCQGGFGRAPRRRHRQLRRRRRRAPELLLLLVPGQLLLSAAASETPRRRCCKSTPSPRRQKLRGAMDSVSDFESGGCGFESRRSWAVRHRREFEKTHAVPPRAQTTSRTSSRSRTRAAPRASP